MGLHCFTQAFSSCSEQGLLSSCSVQASDCGGFSCFRALAQSAWVSVAVAYGLSCLVACRIFLDQGSDPCPLHWQADTQPLDHQGTHFSYISRIGFAGSWGFSSIWLFIYLVALLPPFPKVFIPTYTSTGRVWGFYLFCIHTNTCYCLFHFILSS